MLNFFFGPLHGKTAKLHVNLGVTAHESCLISEVICNLVPPLKKMNEITTFSTKSEELSIRNDFLHFF